MNTIKLQETIPFKYTIDESAKRPGILLALEGVFQRADIKNANGRVYPTSLWKKVMSDVDVSERVGARRMLGELDHPASGSTALSRVSHVITEHKLQSDGTVKGRMEVLDTPSGQIAATLFRAGVQLGISSRGDGSVEKKGDVDEVQTDYRLETYDLVLKPSTPGAYPRIVETEEAAQKNTGLIASAVEGLVKSTSDPDVLLECHKIISVLEGNDAHREAILVELKSKLRGDQQGNRSTTEEGLMQTNEKQIAPPPGVNLSPEMANYLREWVNKGVAEAVAAKDTEIGTLHAQIAELSGQNDGLAERLIAAEALIEEFSRKVKMLSENATTDEDLATRYEASVKLLDEALGKLQLMGDVERRLEAAQQLLAASIVKHQDEAVSRYVESLLSDIEEGTAEKFRSILSEAESVEEAQERFIQVASLLEDSNPPTIPIREPLPPRGDGRQQVVEGNPSPKTSDDYVTRRLLEKCGQ